MLELQKFIFGNKDNWKELLSKDPYNIAIRENDKFIMFNYKQIESNFNEPIVLECRGLILEKETFKVVCFPFTKFWNCSERRAAKIDWESAKISEKIDGSIIKLWYYDNRWNVSTMGCIDANFAGLMPNMKYKNFKELFDIALDKVSLNMSNMDKDYTYIFELVSPYSKLVISYEDIDIYHIGTKNNITFQEVDIDIGVKKPKSFTFKSMDDLLVAARKLPFNLEGYVVCDKNFNRIKVKSPAYVAVHHLKNNGVITQERLLELILLNEHEEFISYYPEFADHLKVVKDRFDDYIKNIREDIDYIYKDKNEFKYKKDFAMAVKKMTNPHIMFQLYDEMLDINNFVDHIMNIPANKLIKMI